MSLKTMFATLKNEGLVIKPLDLYLLSLNEKEDNDRAINVNAPSSSGGCLRSRYYSRTGAIRDSNSVDPRMRRIFDNGTKTHERLQEYLLKQGILLMDEIPVHNYEYNIQGHTDGALALGDGEIGILEIKSIKEDNFKALKCAKEEHQRQGLIYIFCIEQRRLYLRKKYKNKLQFNASLKKRMVQYAALYQHLKGGKKFTREEKIAFQCSLHAKMDSILFSTEVPVTKAVFLYENKNTQELKEFVISSKEAQSSRILKEELESCAEINDYVDRHKTPPRCATKKSDPACRWCNYKTECWN